MRTQEKLMRDAGYVTAADAAEAIGCDNVGTIHRQIQTGKLKGARAGTHWYVLVESLLAVHKDAPPIVERIRALGVEAKPAAEPPVSSAATGAPKASRRRGGGKARVS